MPSQLSVAGHWLVEQSQVELSSAKDALARLSTWQWFAVGGGLLVSYALLRCIYLLYFHPLARFPGPRIAAVSNVWYAYYWFMGRYPWAIEDALKRYGDVVRIAPNELVFTTPQASTDIHLSVVQNRETFVKSNFQDIGEKELGVTAERDPERHRQQRKQLAPGFSLRALRDQEMVIHEHMDRFIRQLEKLGTTGDGVEIGLWFDWLTFDLAGDMGYGKSFDNVKEAKSSFFLSTFLKAGPLGTLIQVMKRFPSLFPLMFLYILSTEFRSIVPRLLKKNREEVRQRVARRYDLTHPDYFAQLLPEKGPVPSEAYLLAQANVLIIAGFDPITNLFTATVYFLLANPDKLQKLAKEIRGAFSEYDQITHDSVQHLKYLLGAIEEGFRLHTPAAFGLPRVSPGATVDGHYIPKGTVVQTSAFATTHSNRYFKHARSFCPERWLPANHPDYDPQFKDDVKEAFKPFGQGPRGCIGMNVGYMEAKIILAKLVWYFDWELTNRNEIDWERDSKLYSIWVRPEVYVRFTRARKESTPL